MTTQQLIDEYLKQYHEDWPEYKYYKKFFEILLALDLPHEERYGYAIMQIFNMLDFRLKDGTILGEIDQAIMGTFEDIAGAVAILFKDIEADHITWKSKRAVNDGRADVWEAFKDLERQLRNHPLIEEVIGTYLD